MRIFCFEKNIYLNSIKNDHADGCRSGCGLIRSILGILELSSEKNHSFITIWKCWFSYEFPLPVYPVRGVYKKVKGPCAKATKRISEMRN